MNASEKRFLIVATAIAVVFVVVVAASVYLLTRDGGANETPYLQATTGDSLARVEPTIYCEIDLSGCRRPSTGRDSAAVPVPAGQSILVSASSGIFDAPWVLTLEYLTPSGFAQDPPQYYRPGSQYAFVARSRPGRLLSTIEVRLPSSRTDTSGSPITRAFWSINTLPPGTPVPTAR